MLLANRSVETVCCSTRPVCEGMGLKARELFTNSTSFTGKVAYSEVVLNTQSFFFLFFGLDIGDPRHVLL